MHGGMIPNSASEGIQIKHRVSINLLSHSRRAMDSILGRIHVRNFNVRRIHSGSLHLLNEFPMFGDLLLHVFDGGIENKTFAATLPFHARHETGEPVKPLADCLTSLLFGGNVIALLLLLGEPRFVL
jgi:hypothetical protein